MKQLIFSLVLLSFTPLSGQSLALLKYDGGGDWYANPTALKNLVDFYNEGQQARVRLEAEALRPGDLLDKAPVLVHATGHGRIFFTPEEVRVLREYVERGGFLHVDDNYGMREFAEAELAKIFPDAVVQSVPHQHPIFLTPYPFPKGLPKIHEHDGETPEAIGYFLNGELVAILTLESDLGDGWEDPEVHNDSEEKRESALKMGANLVHWALLRTSKP